MPGVASKRCVQSVFSACAGGKLSDRLPFARSCNEAAIDPLLIMGWKTDVSSGGILAGKEPSC
jgi:hypothetical protein